MPQPPCVQIASPRTWRETRRLVDAKTTARKTKPQNLHVPSTKGCDFMDSCRCAYGEQGNVLVFVLWHQGMVPRMGGPRSVLKADIRSLAVSVTATQASKLFTPARSDPSSIYRNEAAHPRFCMRCCHRIGSPVEGILARRPRYLVPPGSMDLVPILQLGAYARLGE